jgi:methionyl-tRNA formyltransferase
MEADRLGIPVIQPQKLRESDAVAMLTRWAPELIVVAAYGQILRPEVLDLPRFGCVNVHASLLPRWRGAAPIQAAILEGDRETGITIMKMDTGLDSGPILSQRSIPIGPDDTAGSLSDQLSRLGAELLVETLPGYLSGRIIPRPQDEDKVTRAPMLTKKQGELDFNQAAILLVRQVRAYHPWPGCYTLWQGQNLKIHRAHALASRTPLIGSRLVVEGKPAWGTDDGILVADELQPAGKRSMSGEDFLRGIRNWEE